MVDAHPSFRHRLPRRLLLAATVAGVGCAPAPPTVEQTAPPAQKLEPSPEAPTSSPPASPSAAPTTSAQPTRADVEQRFANRQPEAWGLNLPGIVQRTESDTVALTFDACGGKSGSGYDEALMQTLRKERVPATLFLNTRWIEANRALTEELVADELFTIGNHGTRHLPLSVNGQDAYGIQGTASVGEIYDEIMGCHELLAGLIGKPPRFFRPGTAFYDDVALEIVTELGLIPVGFDINLDAGATFSAQEVTAATTQASAGSIGIGHFNRPGSGTAAGIRDALPRLREGGLKFAALDQALPG